MLCTAAASSLITLMTTQTAYASTAEQAKTADQTITAATNEQASDQEIKPDQTKDNQGTTQTQPPTSTDQPKDKNFYLKIEPRLYSNEWNTESYGGTMRLGAIVQTAKSTTIFEIGPQLLSYQSQPITSIDAAIESYWSLNRSIEVYGRWYPSYVDGYGSKSMYNSWAMGSVFRLNGGIVDVNQYTGLASLSKGQYIKAEQELSTFNGLQWSGNRTSARLGWAAHGKRWSLTLEAGLSYRNDIYNGTRYEPSGVLEWNYQLSKDSNVILSYYPYLNAGPEIASRGELSLSYVKRF